MRRAIFALIAFVGLTGSLLPARAAGPGSRVVVSSTLNGTLHFFDASSLAETQPPLPAKGTSPVRMWVQPIAAKTYLFSANHGVQGSVGVYDLSGDVVTELPLSPFPSGGQGSVGVAAGYTTLNGDTVPMVFVTNTVQALGGCELPEGSVTAFDAELLPTAGVLRQYATVPTHGVIPYAAAFNGSGRHVYASNNCNDTLYRYDITAPAHEGPKPVTWDYQLSEAGHAATGASPDAVIYDESYNRVYVNNIGGNSVSVFDDMGVPRTTVPLPGVGSAPGAGPIDAALADPPSGAHWFITSDGNNDAVSVIDRGKIDECIQAGAATCLAEVARIGTGVPGGAPEGVAYDSATNRVFVVNKGIGKPSLTVIQLIEGPSGVTGTPIATILLRVAGSTGVPVPDLISFDVVVQQR